MLPWVFVFMPFLDPTFLDLYLTVGEKDLL